MKGWSVVSYWHFDDLCRSHLLKNTYFEILILYRKPRNLICNDCGGWCNVQYSACDLQLPEIKNFVPKSRESDSQGTSWNIICIAMTTYRQIRRGGERKGCKVNCIWKAFAVNTFVFPVIFVFVEVLLMKSNLMFFPTNWMIECNVKW